MATKKLQPGDKVRARTPHSGLRGGEDGTVVAQHDGSVFVVNYPGFEGPTYSPGDYLAPADSDDDHDLDDPDATPTVSGQPSSGPNVATPKPASGSGWTASTWQTAMDRVLAHHRTG